MKYFNILTIVAAFLVGYTTANASTFPDKQNYRYSFDVVDSNIWIGLGLSDMRSCEDGDCEQVVDESIYQEFLRLHHPFGWAFGKTGRVVFETSYRVVFSGGIVSDPWDIENTAACVSGFLCTSDGGIKFNQTQLRPLGPPTAPGMISKKLQDPSSSFGEAGFSFQIGDDFVLNLEQPVNGTKGGVFRFGGDDFSEFRGEVNGTQYEVNDFAGATFLLENATVERLGPPAVPLPASGVTMFSMLGAGLVLSIRRRRKNCSQRFN